MRRFYAALTMTALASPAIAQGTARASAEAFVTSALATARAGDTAQALKLLDQARKADAKYAPAYFHRGVLLAHTTAMGFTDTWTRHQAASALEKSLELEPNNPWAY